MNVRIIIALSLILTSQAPAQAAGGNQGKFSSTCFYSHSAPDDPIVFPDKPGYSHEHDFIGNTSTNAASTTQSLLDAPSNCADPKDHAAYWVPTLSYNGHSVHPHSVTVYYLSNGKNNVRPYPLGLHMLAGDPHAPAPDPANHVFWGCSDGPPHSLVPQECPAGELVHVRINFPDCWDGVHFDSPNHRSHVAYSRRGACPDGYPVEIPALSMLLKYGIPGGSGVTTASGAGYTMHGDFINAWEPRELERLVRSCDVAGIKCKKFQETE